MHDTNNTSQQQQVTLLGRIGANPLRPLTIREWWHENEPVDFLTDPEAVFREEERTMLRLCAVHGIAHRAATATCEAAFPIWLYRELSSVTA